MPKISSRLNKRPGGGLIYPQPSAQCDRLDDVVPPAFPILAEVKDVPLHLFGESLELVPKAGEYLPLAGDEVGNPSVRAEIAYDDDAVVGEDELFQTFLVSPIHDVGEDGVAVTAEEVFDDIGADFAVGGVVEGVAHMRHCLGYIYIYCKTCAVFHFL